MVEPKKNGDKWLVDFRPDGVTGRRIIRKFQTKADANRFIKDFLSGRIEPLGDNRRLSQLINDWYDLHGVSLKSAAGTKSRLLLLASALGDPVAQKLSVPDFSRYRRSRLDAGVMPATLNRELQTLKAVFRELKRLSVIDYETPLLTVRNLKEAKTELTYLTHNQIAALLTECRKSRNRSVFYVALISLATGARWSESEALTIKNCKNGGFTFLNTKNGSDRFVPVSPEVFDVVTAFLRSESFTSCRKSFERAIKRASIELPQGQASHVLRHTFASHFVMSGGNLRSLQTILGHSSLTVTTRYAHLSPDYLSQAVTCGPLSVFTSGNNVESGDTVPKITDF
ncbi:phage integrase [Methylomonas koyamae]|uniref:phage integrase n=1 Tax=Methylomonas koyamae TaxID=702114 RepID=UPI002872F938|nr:tyrosine-type recombinase/integrase [Methylomonas koyamae]WNB77585.1 tyrosine-type recombinase/integrase [Methylomonas koyamae]